MTIRRRAFQQFGAATTLPFEAAARPDFVPAGSSAPPEYDSAECEKIYRLLGYATMSGEDPLALRSRLRPARTWLTGPLARDGSLGQAFIADHQDIFGFRFAPLAPQWLAWQGLRFGCLEPMRGSAIEQRSAVA